MSSRTSQRLVCALALGFLSQAADAQTLADYEFIHWEPVVPDPRLRSLRLDDSGVGALGGAEAHVVEPAVRTELMFRANGDVRQSFRASLQFLDSSGIEQRGNTSIFVDSYAEELFIKQAAVLTADGDVIGVDPATLQVLVEDSGGVFSDVVQLVVPWPNLAPGSIAVIEYDIAARRSRLAAPWSRVFYPRSLTPRAHYELHVSWEPGAARPSVMTDFAELACVDAAERQIVCEARNVAAAETDFDVNYVDELPYVVVAEDVSWNDLARTIGGYVKRSYTDEAAVREIVERITAGADGDFQKLEAIHSFVSKEIRYVGIETGINGIVPRDTGLTLERRFGDCKDKTALFLQMAEIAGIGAYPVLVSSHRKNIGKLSVPSVSYFDHMLACGRVGTVGFCVDLTDPHTSARTFPIYLHGAVTLPLLHDIEKPIAAQPTRFAWTMSVTSNNSFDGRTVIEHERREYGGAFSGVLRSSLDSLSSADLTTWAVNDYQQVSGSQAEPTFKFTGLRDQHEPLIVESDVTYPNVILDDGPVNYIHVPGWLVDLVAGFATKNEHYAYRFPGLSYRDTTTFAIGAGRVQALGAAVDFESEFGTMQRVYRYADDTISVETTVELPNRVVALEEIESFNGFLNVIRDNATARFRFDPQAAAP